MQIKRMWPVDDLPEVLATSSTTTNNGLTDITGFNILRTGTAPSYWGAPNSIGVIKKIGRKWLYGICNVSLLPIALAPLNLAWTGKVVLGYRVMTENAVNTRGGSLFSQVQALFYEFLLAPNPGNGNPPNLNLSANVEYYIEVVLDFVALTARCYVNGSLVASGNKTFTSAQMATIITTYNVIVIGAYNGTGNWYYRDINIREYGPSETYNPMANFEIQRAPLVIAPNADFVTSNGDTLNNVLNTDMTGPLSAAVSPTAEAPGGAGASAPVIASIGAWPGVEGTVLGVEAYTTLKSFGDAPAVMRSKLTQNATDANFPALTLTGGFQYRKPTGVQQTAPDGSALTKANIASTILTLTTAAS